VSRDTRATANQSVFERTYRTLTLGIVAIITVMAFEAMGVVTAMPIAVRELDGLVWYAWAFTAFSVTSLYAMVVAGEWADRLGPMRPLVAGASLFALGLFVAGLAKTMPQFLAGRAIQGLGFGATIVAIYVVIGRCYPESIRPRMFTALSGAWVIPGILGPAVAGWITDNVGWRWVFLAVLLLMVPISAVLVPRLMRFRLPGDPDHQVIAGRKRRALLAAAGTGMLQYAAQRHDRWGLLVLVVAVVLLAVSVPHLLPAGTLRLRRGLPTVVAERGVMAGAFFAAEAFVPLMLVSQRHLAAGQAGAAISGAALGWFGGSYVQGRPRYDGNRLRLVQAAAWLVALGIALTTLVVLPGVPAAVSLLTWGLGGFGMGIIYASLGVLMLEYSSPQEQGVNSSSLQVADSLGVIAMTGLVGAVYAIAQSSGGATDRTFIVIFVVTTVVAVFGAIIAPRLDLGGAAPGHAA